MRDLFNKIQTNVLNEATFYGKNDSLLALEKVVDTLQVQMKSFDHAASFKSTIPAMEEILEKMFGFERVFINVSSTGTHTVPAFISTKSIVPFNSKFKASVGKTGPTFSKKDGLKTYLNLGFELFNSNLTSEEIVAVILHEIGHSFAYTIKNRILLMFPSYIICGVIMSTLQVGSMNMPNLLKKINTVFSYYHRVNAFILSLLSEVLAMLNFIPLMGIYTAFVSLMHLSLNPAKCMHAFIMNDDEIFADAFATSYGYGGALNTALAKFRVGPNNLKLGDKLEENDFFAWIQAHNVFTLSLAMQLLSPHPTDFARINNSKKFLEASVAGTKNPKLKAELQMQLRELSAIEKSVLNDFPPEIKQNVETINELEANGKYMDTRKYLSEFNDGNFTNIDFKK